MSFWILFIVTMALSLWAAARMKSVYRKYSQLPVRSGLTRGGLHPPHSFQIT